MLEQLRLQELTPAPTAHQRQLQMVVVLALAQLLQVAHLVALQAGVGAAGIA